MKATDVLKHEHQAIMLVIAAIEKEVASIGKTGKVHMQLVRETVDFLSNFVDRCHHTKEEKHLSVVMHRRGMPMDTGPLATMLHEHELGRACVRAIAEAVQGKGVPVAAAIRKAEANMAAYARLLRSHIHKEDHVLFTIADRILDMHDQELLCDAFDKVESEEMGKGVHEKYHSWIGKLVDRKNRGQVAKRKQEGGIDEDPIVVMADKALAEGSADEMIKRISGYLAAAAKENLQKVMKARKNKDKSAEAAREFVEAYVTYMHYAENVYYAIVSAGGHQRAEAVEC